MTSPHHKRWLKRCDEKPSDDNTAFAIVNTANAWHRVRKGKHSPGFFVWQRLLKANPKTLGVAYAAVKKLDLETARTDYEVWKHIAWLDTWEEEEGFPFVKIG